MDRVLNSYSIGPSAKSELSESSHIQTVGNTFPTNIVMFSLPSIKLPFFFSVWHQELHKGHISRLPLSVIYHHHCNRYSCSFGRHSDGWKMLYTKGCFFFFSCTFSNVGKWHNPQTTRLVCIYVEHTIFNMYGPHSESHVACCSFC